MTPIVTITFSPCIDKSAAIPRLLPEKKLRCHSVKSEPGGGGINVARAIQHLGGDVHTIYPSGGYSGQYFNELLKAEGVASTVISSGSDTRENIIILDEAAQRQYRFGMPAAPLTEGEWKQCMDALKAIDKVEFIVVSGSMPPAAPPDLFAALQFIASYKNAKLVVDTSGDALKQAVWCGAYLIKPNLSELAALAGLESIRLEDAEIIAKEVIRKSKVEVIVVSLGMNGAILVTEKECYKIVPPQVKVRSTVGAGDSMLGGIVYRLSQGSHLNDALAYGVACGTAATLNPGTQLCRKEDVAKIYRQITRMTAVT